MPLRFRPPSAFAFPLRPAGAAFAVAGLLWALSAAPARADTDAAAARCAATARQPSADPRITVLVREAVAQHVAFGGQSIDTRGRLVSAGYQEAEFDRAEGDPVPTWRKVQRFWQSLDPAEPRQVRSAGGGTVDLGLLRQSLRGVGAGRLQSFGSDVGLTTREANAIETSLARAALVDNPWSAAFVSYLARTAGLSASEFAFSDAHVTYVDAAFVAAAAEQSPAAGATDYAYRACDIARTTPRPGDLLCHTRDAAAVHDRFPRLAAALEDRRGALLRGGFAMHCDLVVEVDRQAAKVDTVGGNVLQSVTRRRMDLSAERAPALSARYFAGPPSASTPAGCAAPAEACRDRGFNSQPWAVLLQYRK